MVVLRGWFQGQDDKVLEGGRHGVIDNRVESLKTCLIGGKKGVIADKNFTVSNVGKVIFFLKKKTLEEGVKKRKRLFKFDRT